jgi:hypothetical protein
MKEKDPEYLAVPGMMKGDLPEEFLKKLGFKKAVIDESCLFDAKDIHGVVPHPDGPVGLRFFERYIKNQEEHPEI